MTVDKGERSQLDRGTQTRNEPVQARSAARLETLLDAAAQVVDEVGYERLTTAMVADRAEASIGTVYRYYPDRIALLQGLSARSFQRYVSAVTARVAADDRGTWWEAIDSAIDLYTDMFRTEPGFRAIRFGDALDLGPAEGQRTNNSVLATEMARQLTARFPVPDEQSLVFALEVAVEMIDALLYRAFTTDAEGDERFITEARVVTRAYLSRHLNFAA